MERFSLLRREIVSWVWITPPERKSITELLMSNESTGDGKESFGNCSHLLDDFISNLSSHWHSESYMCCIEFSIEFEKWQNSPKQEQTFVLVYFLGKLLFWVTCVISWILKQTHVVFRFGELWPNCFNRILFLMISRSCIAESWCDRITHEKRSICWIYVNFNRSLPMFVD